MKPELREKLRALSKDQAAYDELIQLVESEVLAPNNESVKFQNFADYAPDLILEVDDSGRILYANKSLSGVSSFELPGTHVTDYIGKDFRTPLLEAIGEVVAHGVCTQLEIAGRRGGIWFSARLGPHETASHVKTAILIMSDVSAKKIMEESLDETVKNYTYLWEHANDSIIISEPETHTILAANRLAAARLGYTLDEFVGKTTDDITSKKGKADLRMIRMNLDDNDSFIFETFHLTKTRKEVAVEVSSREIDYRGKRAFLNFVRDISERKRSAEMLSRKNNELNAFIYRASHDLKGPLASIQGLLNVADSEVTDGTAAHYFELIRRCTERLDKNLVDLIEITWIKQAGINVSKIDFQTLVSESIHGLQNILRFDDVLFQIDLHQRFDFFSDLRLLKSIIQNFLSNSIKYSSGLNRKPEIHIGVHDHEKGVELVIADNGIGIAQEEQERIFDMFYRAHQHANGTGLGMYIIKMAVEKLGGKIQLQSENGQGAKFMVYLPSCPN